MIAFMSIDHIVALLVRERAKLNRAIEALQAGAKTEAPRPEAPVLWDGPAPSNLQKSA